MNLDAVLAKTEKGKEELAARRDLTADLRHALILVDGHSTLKELLKKGEGLPHLADSLNMLAQMGLIASTAENASVVAASPPLTPETVSQAASGSMSVKAKLVLLANNLLGNQAGKIIKKIEEAADTYEALLSAIDSCGKVIRLVIDEDKADMFVVSAKDILSRSSKR